MGQKQADGSGAPVQRTFSWSRCAFYTDTGSTRQGLDYSVITLMITVLFLYWVSLSNRKLSQRNE